MSSVFYYEPYYEFEKLLDDAFGYHQANGGNQLQRRGVESPVASTNRPLKPRMDLHEDSANNMVTATFELPGLKKENVAIDVHNGRLTVSGESKLSIEHDEHGYAIRERRHGKFSRTLQLPQGVKEDEIKARMEDGVLLVSFPKTSTELTPRKINIS
ncbi:Small heat shock protein C4 [Termitomyces sp. J132]|nr:Small heat shock protein C4 [Termitomyces sp. J132]